MNPSKFSSAPKDSVSSQADEARPAELKTWHKPEITVLPLDQTASHSGSSLEAFSSLS